MKHVREENKLGLRGFAMNLVTRTVRVREQAFGRAFRFAPFVSFGLFTLWFSITICLIYSGTEATHLSWRSLSDAEWRT